MRLFLYFFFTMLFFGVSLAEDNNKSQRNILVIHSYHEQLEWTKNINGGIQSILSNQNDIHNIYIEYLDFKRHQSKSLYQYYSELFKEKYRNDNISLVIVSDNFAFEFILEYRQQFLKDTPIVFCGLNDYSTYKEKIGKNITGIAEVSEVDSSLALALALFPRTTDVAIITDTTITSRSVYKQYFPQLMEQYPNLKFYTFRNLSEQKLLTAVKSLPKTSICLQIGYFFDEHGRYEDYGYRLKTLSENTSKPIFAIWKFFLGKGIFGGKLTNPYEQGVNAAKLGLQILSGKNIEDIPVLSSVGNRWMFDYNILEKFEILTLQLPTNSMVINRPPSSYTVNKYIIIAIGAIFLVLILAIMLLYRRIIERRKIEDQLLRATQKAEKATKLKSEFLAQMSHEIRTPINIILSYSNFIRAELDTNLTEELSECFDSIKSGSDRLIRTIDLILKVSELQTGIVDIEKKTTDLYKDIILPLAAEFELHAKNKGLKIEIDVTKNVTDVVVDQYMMRQAIANLIDNSIKYSSKGTIKIGLGENATGKIFITISDEGIGIDKQYMETIFEPFSQEQQGYGRIYEGNGLGLTLVKKYCKINDAEIEIESKKDVGSTFTITFNNSEK